MITKKISSKFSAFYVFIFILAMGLVSCNSIANDPKENTEVEEIAEQEVRHKVWALTLINLTPKSSKLNEVILLEIF
jgi:hypothetical protein